MSYLFFVMNSTTLQRHSTLVISSHLTDVVAAGGSDGLVDHLLTHDAVECLLDTTQQTSLREGNKSNEYIYSTV